jgi:YHS domain-containing protein
MIERQNMKPIKLMVVLLLAVCGFRGTSLTSSAAVKTEPKPYPLSTCLITGEKLGGSMGKPVVITAEDREIKFCCKGCLQQYQKNPADYMKKLEAAEQQAARKNPYPLDTCLVLGEKLGSMGEGYTFVYEDKEIKLCCSGCLNTFKKDTAKYLKKLELAKKTSK